MISPPPPPELLEQRPCLLGEDVRHPLTDPRLGDPPRKYSRAVHERICEELAKGQRPQGACAIAGITVATFYNWVRKGKEGDPWLAEFADDVEIAFNKAEARAVEVVTEGFLTEDPERRNSEDAKWFLERARPDGYSKQVKSAVENQLKEFMLRLEAALDEETFMKVLAVYLGQSPAAEIGHKQIAQLPPHDEEAVDSEKLSG